MMSSCKMCGVLLLFFTLKVIWYLICLLIIPTLFIYLFRHIFALFFIILVSICYF